MRCRPSTIELVDLRTFAEVASRILNESWVPPCLAYEPDYLRWEFASPGPNPAIGVAAFDGDEPIGFGAAIPRRLRLQGVSRSFYLISFLSVLPSRRGCGIASALYTGLIEAVKATQVPVITFAEKGSVGQAALERGYARAGFRLHPLGSYQARGRLVGPASSLPVGIVTEEPDLRDFYEAVTPWHDDREILWHAPNPAGCVHLRADPRPRKAVIARGPDGQAAAALAILDETRTVRGPTHAAILDTLILRPGTSVAVLAALLDALSQGWLQERKPTMLTLPNPSGIEEALLREAGLRNLSARFDGYLASSEDHGSILETTATNLAVV